MKTYQLGPIGKIEITKENYYKCYLNGDFLSLNGKDKERVKEKITNYFNHKKNELRNFSPNSELFGLILKENDLENGLRKISEYYQTLQNKKMKGGKK